MYFIILYTIPSLKNIIFTKSCTDEIKCYSSSTIYLFWRWRWSCDNGGFSQQEELLHSALISCGKHFWFYGSTHSGRSFSRIYKNKFPATCCFHCCFSYHLLGTRVMRLQFVVNTLNYWILFNCTIINLFLLGCMTCGSTLGFFSLIWRYNWVSHFTPMVL